MLDVLMSVLWMIWPLGIALAVVMIWASTEAVILIIQALINYKNQLTHKNMADVTYG